MSIFLMLLLGAGLGSLLDKPPRDLASLIEPKSMLVQMNQDTSEDALILALTTTTGLTLVAEDRLRQAAENLGAEHYKDRMRAKRLLEVAGAAALPFLEKAANSDDPEVRSNASSLLESARKEQLKAQGLGDVQYAKKLMAIRLLESRKSQKALPALRTLSKDERPTLADAAQNAMLVIEGKEPVRPEVKALLEGMAQRIPPDAAFACLLDFATGARSITVGALLTETTKDPRFQMFSALGGVDDGQAMMTEELQKNLGLVGNIRVDAVGMIISRDLGTGPEKGYLGFVIKGLCEPTLMDAFLKREFENSYEHAGATVYYRSDVAVCRIDKNTVVIGISEQNDGHQVDSLVSAFSGELSEVDYETLAKRHPIIIPALTPVIRGEARFSVGGALSEEQQTVASGEMEKDINRTKKRLADDNSPRNQVNMAMTTIVAKLIKAKALSCSLRKGSPLSVVATLTTEKEADELRNLLVSADTLLREQAKSELANGNSRPIPGMKEMFGDLEKPYLVVTQEKNVITTEFKSNAFFSLIFGL